MRRFFSLLLILFYPFLTFSNGLKIRDLMVVSDSKIRFSVSWENSWNVTSGANNHDAVWIFIKHRYNDLWAHQKVAVNEQDYLVSDANFSVKPASDGNGFFIYPNTYLVQDVVNLTVEINFYSVIDLNAALRVFGIEMVYVPEAAFELGDRASVNTLASNSGDFVLVNSENEVDAGAISVKNINAMYADQTPTVCEGLTAEFPKGFAAFYVMKYEISQQQYTDFLNCLSPQQQEARTQAQISDNENTLAMIPVALNNMVQQNADLLDSVAARNGISISTSGYLADNKRAYFQCNYHFDWLRGLDDDGKGIAANWLSWADLAAYLDWAALRPLSEMEFEKACRGTDHTFAGQMPWGNNVSQNVYSIENEGFENETIAETYETGKGIANYGYDISGGVFPVHGPLRVGFAGTHFQGRLPLGASFYGIVEMAGNVWEQCVSVHYNLFKASAGDGNILANGSQNQADWPQDDAKGVILRGGAWNSLVSEINEYNDLSISSRFYAHLLPNMRRNTTGGRGGRSAE